MAVPDAFHAPLKGGRPLKRWRYVGVFGDELMACFGAVRIGVLPQAFWAVLDGDELRERTRFRPGAVDLSEGAVRVRRRRRPGRSRPPASRSRSSTARRAADLDAQVARARARHAGRASAVDLPALVDESAGYHARVTEWEWAAGAGVDADGRDVRWNLVTGIHDGATGSERRVWVDGTPHEVGPVTFSPGLDEVRFAEGRRCASRRAPSARAATTWGSSPATTASRSAPPRARCPAASSWRRARA